MNKKILDTQSKLLRLFRPPPTVTNDTAAGSNATPGPRIGEELNNHDKFLADYLATWRTQTQDPIQ